MGIDCGNEGGPSSPVFHKKKWVVLPTSVKRPSSGSLLNKCPEKKLKNKRKNDSHTSLKILDLNITMPPEDEPINKNVDEDDKLLIYNSTPTKKCKQKRKTIDLLSCSFRSEGSFCKKSKLSDGEHAELSKNPSGIRSDKNIEQCSDEVSSQQSIKKSSLSQKSITSKPQRKLLYSCHEKSDLNLITQTVTVNDIFKSVIMIDEADIYSSPKKNRQLGFEVGCNDFQSVTSLTSGSLKGCPEEVNDLISPPHVVAPDNCNDSFGNCMFTEIENETTKEVCLKEPPITPDNSISSVDPNPMDETFSNYRFTEIEEDYGCFNHKRLKENDLVASSSKSKVLEPASSCPNSQNCVGKNTCSTSDKNDSSVNEIISHESTVLNKIVKAESYHSIDNERYQDLLDDNHLEDSYLKPCSIEKDIFNSTLSSQKSVPKLESAIDKEHFLSTSKECFDNLDAISTEEFRHNQLENNHELDGSLKEDILNQSTDNLEKELLNKSSVSKLNLTLTDIMQGLLKKKAHKGSKPSKENQNLDKNNTYNGNDSFNSSTLEIADEKGTKNHEQYGQTLENISSSECIPGPSGMLDTSETAFLTQEYLENVKPEVSIDTSVAYYQQSFDYMISAEVKSRLSGNNCFVPTVDQEQLLFDQSSSSEVCLMAESGGRSPDDSFININGKQTNFNESKASNLNESMNITKDIDMSSKDIDYFNKGPESKFSQSELISKNSFENNSLENLSDLKDHTESNNIEIHSCKVFSIKNQCPIETSPMPDISSSNSDFISQGCLQQFDSSFMLDCDDSSSLTQKKNLADDIIQEINVSNIRGPYPTFLKVDTKNIHVSEDCLRNDKSKDILDQTNLIMQNDTTINEMVFYEDKLIEKNNMPVNLKKNLNKYQTYSEKKFINTAEVNEYNLHLGIKNSTHSNVNSDIAEAVQSDCPVVFQKPNSPITRLKSDADFGLSTASGKSINVSNESLKKIRSLLNDDLVGTNKDNIWQCLTDFDVTNSNINTDNCNSDKKNLTEIPSSVNKDNKNIDISENALSDVQKTEAKTDIDHTFKSPLPRPSKINNFMFSSAGSKKIKFSPNSLAKVKSVFNDMSKSDPTDNNNTEDKTVLIHQAHKTSLPSTSKACNYVFSSTNSQKVEVLEDALTKIKSKSDEISASHLIENSNTVDKSDFYQASKSSLASSIKVDQFNFSSASGKNITISKDALAKVKSKFNDIFEDRMEVKSSDAEIDAVRAPQTSFYSTCKNSDLLLSSSSDKNINISEDTLIENKPKHSEISENHLTENKNTDDKTDNNQVTETSLPSSRKKDYFMFSTASGHNIKVSDVALDKVKSKFHEIMESHETEAAKEKAETNIDREPRASLPSSIKAENFMFSSASGKNIKISKDALAKVKSKFNDIFEDRMEVKGSDTEIDAVRAPQTSFYSTCKNSDLLLSSSSDKNINISEDALIENKPKHSEISENHLTENKNTDDKTDNNQVTETSLPSSRKKDYFMFSTASGHNIKVSDVALDKVKSKFHEIMESHETEAAKEKAETNIDREPRASLPSSIKAENFMFSSASGKNVKVSENALAKAKLKFNDIIDNHPTKNKTYIYVDKTENDHASKNFLPSSSKAGSFMLQIASSETVKISEEPSVQVESNPDKILESHPITNKNTHDKTDVNPVAQVQSKFNEIFETRGTEVHSIETETGITQVFNKPLPLPCKIDNFMFSTAGGQNITISDVALDKVKSIFNEIMDSHDTEYKNTEEIKNIDQKSKSSFTSSNKVDDFIISSASDKRIKNSKDSLTDVKSEFIESFGNSLNAVKNSDDKADIKQTPTTYFSSYSKNNKFMFSTGSGKNIEISDFALAKVKSKFNQIMENHDIVATKDNVETKIDQSIGSSKANNFMFSSASGKKVNVSENALASVSLKFREILESDLAGDKIDKSENKTDDNQAPKTFLINSVKADNFMFSSASGKNIKVSQDSLSKVKSKFNEIFENSLIELKDTKTETISNPESTSLYDKGNSFMFFTTNGNNVGVSDIYSTKVKSKLNEISENILDKEENDEIEINECQLMDTSFSCFDKTFSFSNKESKHIEISEVVLDEMKSELNVSFKDNSTEVEFHKSRNESVESKIPLEISNKKGNPISFSTGFSGNLNVKDVSEIKFSTARGKHISVSEDALLNVKSKFSDIIDNTQMHLLNAESNNYLSQANNPQNQNLPDTFCWNPVLEKKNSNNSESCSNYNYIPMSNNQISKKSQIFTNVNVEKGLSNCINQKDKKSKFSHSENYTSDQPSAKKVCFQPGIKTLTQKSSNNSGDHNIPKESKMPYFTQSISQSLLDKEMDIIEEQKDPRKNFNQWKNESNSKCEESLENKDVKSNKFFDQSRTEERDLSMIYEVSDSAAAFMADCTPDRSVLSSPSSFFSRKSMKPIKLLEMEFDDVDDEIMVAAELKINPEQSIKKPITNDLANNSVGSINFRSCSIEVLSVRSDQRKRADEIIHGKLKCRPPSSPGLYLTLRNQGGLKRIVDNLQPSLDKEQLGLKEEVMLINSTNAASHEFLAESFFSYDECFSTEGIINVGYGFSLILSDENKIGLPEYSRCFLSNPNVDPSLVSSAWIRNHFRWIVWKLACYERAFSRQLAYRYFTPENLLHQLKYRYDREIDLAQRPALKKILECDEPSSRRMILCVADIRNVDLSDGESNYEIELTDGWYSVWACIDMAMKNLINRQKLKIGLKLVVQAAELLNCSEGCDPLEITSSIRLKLHTNCVRRVKWHTKMGFTQHPGPIRVSLGSILHNGGLVGLTSAIIARVYPLLYMSKDANGKTVFRNAYAENHASSMKENDLRLKSEELFEKLFPEVEAKYKSGSVKFDKNNITKIKDPALLWKIVSNEPDPSEVQSLMTPIQLAEVQKYHELISSKIREEVQALVKEKLEELIPSQKAKCLLKVRLVDPVGSCNALLTVWNPSEDILHILVEKKCFDFYALNASGIRDKVLQLSSTNRTIYKESKGLKPSKEFERKITTIHDIVSNSVSVQFGEMDVVGTVIFVKEPEKPWGVTNVYLSDSQGNFLMITFWTSLKTFGCDETLKPGSTVACINLQWRQGSGSFVIPSTFANEMTYFSSNPNQEYLIEAIQEIKSSIGSKDLENFIIEQKRRLFTILKEREYNSKTPVSRVETPKVSNLKRLENLKKYGEASPLPKLSLLSSPDIHRKFRSPKSGGS